MRKVYDRIVSLQFHATTWIALSRPYISMHLVNEDKTVWNEDIRLACLA